MSSPTEPPNTFEYEVFNGKYSHFFSGHDALQEFVLTAHEANKARAVREARHELLNRFATSHTHGWVLKELDVLEPD